ncbi:hypothetical protein [Sphingomonas sp. DC2300-3]|uniref:hypothetical protein n=1 Tax=unclassified Sphingomonas TaxID=196159 RepID=UPI003CF583BA
MKIAVGVIAALLAAEAGAGPLSKFDAKAPEFEMTSTKQMGDIERCLIDLNGVPAPNVYRQPDRPDDVTILWLANGAFNGTALGRADLRRTPSGTTVKLWLKDKSARLCA